MIGYVVPHKLYPAGYHCDPKLPLPFANLGSQKNHMSLHLMTVYGDPATEILRYAREAEADTIVMGSRGRGRLAGLLLGSVSQKVASLAPQVTIIVPQDR